MKKGFTLVELLVVLAILGVVGTISFVSINKVLLKGKQKTLENLHVLAYTVERQPRTKCGDPE